jgi:hypothetical protein
MTNEKVALVKAIKGVKNKFNSLNVQRALFWDEEGRLKELKGKEKKEFIKNYAEFWHTYSTLYQIMERLYFSIIQLEELKNDQLKKLTSKEGTSISNYEMGVVLSDNFFQYVYMLIKVFEDNSSSNKERDIFRKIMARDYGEMLYLQLLRNEFVQHPQLEDDYQNSRTSCEFRNDKLPLYHCWPGAIGTAIISKYHLSQIRNRQYLKLPYNKMAELNKRYFLSKKGTRKNCSKDFIHRLKVHGLPSIDQEQLANELSSFFDKIVFPFIENKVKEAKERQICF